MTGLVPHAEAYTDLDGIWEYIKAESLGTAWTNGLYHRQHQLAMRLFREERSLPVTGRK